jgi:hypothetical protein
MNVFYGISTRNKFTSKEMLIYYDGYYHSNCCGNNYNPKVRGPTQPAILLSAIF